MHKVRTQYNYFTFPEREKYKSKKKVKYYDTFKMNPQITIQGLDTSIFSMLENGLTQEGETKQGNYTENLLVNAFTDELEFETQFEKEYNRQFFDNLQEANRVDANSKTAEQSDGSTSEALQKNEATEGAERSDANS